MKSGGNIGFRDNYKEENREREREREIEQVIDPRREKRRCIYEIAFMKQIIFYN